MTYTRSHSKTSEKERNYGGFVRVWQREWWEEGALHLQQVKDEWTFRVQTGVRKRRRRMASHRRGSELSIEEYSTI
jgi:hypothetical protein